MTYLPLFLGLLNVYFSFRAAKQNFPVGAFVFSTLALIAGFAQGAL